MSKMHSAFLPDVDAVFHADLRCAYETRELHPADFKDLYTPEWGNALCSSRPQLDMLGVGAYDRGRLIDVLPDYRRQGIASALTNLLARAILEHEKVPFYGAAWSNIRSIKNGLRCGFRPAWAEITAE